MTTELYPNDYFGDINKHDIVKETETELKWLIDEIVKPELPNIIDNVEKCLDMLQSNEVFKMPITNNNGNNLQGKSNANNGPTIRGIISRQNEYIVGFQTIVTFPEFNKGKPIILKMEPEASKFKLPQLVTTKDNLSDLLHTLEDSEIISDSSSFISNMDKSLKLLAQSISLLETPPRNLIFPEIGNNVIKELFPSNHSSLFETPHHEISLELVLIKNELYIDFRNLVKVVKVPWCKVDPNTSLSFVDNIKEELKVDRRKNLKDVLISRGLQVEESNLFNNLLISAFNTEKTTLSEARNFLSRCITFNNKVVIEGEKIVATTSDPSLISLSSKLHSLESTIGNLYTNLNTYTPTTHNNVTK
ncbi:hypothetical protein TPHA_0C02250 [Tetrapisispora phaffii CBS 4417]|uniref:RAVE subunit 2/Rogdi n=1 Tax=Tetrapisispora phaffii (strain ATCC 24235 / CBS 4417 / NBRC 1672 / NRRL Y-8282 / UCD 70-5) TaxID=1071381 RepID=G8BRK2_TETPH|nr:hypothetical protein TPHA_0C02250 [Tetrapisispora phaffii CBS 4417]CCE62378.1 hypothetical protein TPHA_0C02250 [Tetrapisispora phaffii CBS 4417]